MSYKIKQLRLKLEELLPWFTATLVALSADWAGDALMKTFNVWFSGAVGVFSLSRGIYILIFIVSTIALYLQRHTFFRPRTRYLKNEEPPRRRHLILFLSNLDLDKGKFYDGVPDGLNITGDLDRDMKRMEVLKENKPPLRWSWEMPLRGLRHHLGVLEAMTIVCSDKSIGQVHWFLDICQRYDQLNYSAQLN